MKNVEYEPDIQNMKRLCRFCHSAKTNIFTESGDVMAYCEETGDPLKGRWPEFEIYRLGRLASCPFLDKANLES